MSTPSPVYLHLDQEVVPTNITNVIRYTGEREVPRNIRRHRANNLDTMRRFGTPVLVKHMYNDQDVQDGIAEPSPVFNSIYKQSRRNDPVSHGIGFVSVEKAEDEWINPNNAKIVKSATSPGSGFVKAPKYRGFGPGYLTYAILPDVSEDVFKITEAGVFIRTQQAMVQMGWYPELNDNDLLVVVAINNKEEIVETRERFSLKMTTPLSMRGLDRQGRKDEYEDFGNRHITDQQFQMALIPDNDVLMNVETDR